MKMIYEKSHLQNANQQKILILYDLHFYLPEYSFLSHQEFCIEKRRKLTHHCKYGIR